MLSSLCDVMPLGRWNDDEDSSSCGGCQRPAAGNRRRYDPTESSEPEFLEYNSAQCSTWCKYMPSHTPSNIHKIYVRKILFPLNQFRIYPSSTWPRASVNDSGSESLSSDSDAEQLTSEVVELSLQRLQSLHATQKGSVDEVKNKYAEHGMSKSRLKNVLKNSPCQCQCSLPIRVLMMITQAFWRLTKPAQDSLLWSLQHEVGPGRKRWSMQGYPLCKDAWATFLGVGKHRLNRCKKRFHGKDLRSISGPGGN